MFKECHILQLKLHGLFVFISIYPFTEYSPTGIRKSKAIMAWSSKEACRVVKVRWYPTLDRYSGTSASTCSFSLAGGSDFSTHQAFVEYGEGILLNIPFLIGAVVRAIICPMVISVENTTPAWTWLPWPKKPLWTCASKPVKAVTLWMKGIVWQIGSNPRGAI